MKCRHVIIHPVAGAGAGAGRIASSRFNVVKSRDGCEDNAAGGGMISGVPRSFSPILGRSRIVGVQYCN